MKPVSLSQIETFLKSESFVLFGVSENKNKTGNAIMKELSGKGYNIFPVHREMESIEGHKCFRNIESLPEKVESAIICTKPENTVLILKELKQNGISNVWMQLGACNDEIYAKSVEEFDNFIYKKCIFMFANPVGVHKFHSGITKLFGKYPK